MWASTFPTIATLALLCPSCSSPPRSTEPTTDIIPAETIDAGISPRPAPADAAPTLAAPDSGPPLTADEQARVDFVRMLVAQPATAAGVVDWDANDLISRAVEVSAGADSKTLREPTNSRKERTQSLVELFEAVPSDCDAWYQPNYGGSGVLIQPAFADRTNADAELIEQANALLFDGVEVHVFCVTTDSVEECYPDEDGEPVCTSEAFPVPKPQFAINLVSSGDTWRIRAWRDL